MDDIRIDLGFDKVLSGYFGFKAGVSRIVLSNVTVGPLTSATVFFDKNQGLYVFIATKSKLLLADVRKILSKMNLRPEAYLPPKGNTSYFDDAAKKKFLERFPGRANITSEDLVYYRTLVPYSPALVKVAEVKDGCVKIFDSDSRGNWRTGAKLNYFKIRSF
jgi:hypothetical protein